MTQMGVNTPLLSRFFQGHVRRPGQALLRQGAQTTQEHEISSRVRQKGPSTLVSVAMRNAHRSPLFFFSLQVDMKKVNLEVIKPWIAKKVTELVGFEDEVVIEYAMGLLEDPHHTVRAIIDLTLLFSAYTRLRHPTPRKCK